MKPFRLQLHDNNKLRNIQYVRTLSRVVIARVAMLLLESEIRFSRSTLHEVTASGWTMAILFRVFTAENRIVGLEEVKNI